MAGPGLELGVELGGDEIGMIIEFHHLTPTSALILPGESHPRLLDDAHSVRIHLVSVSMALIVSTMLASEAAGEASSPSSPSAAAGSLIVIVM